MDLKAAIDEWLSTARTARTSGTVKSAQSAQYAQLANPKKPANPFVVDDEPDPKMPEGRLLTDGRATRKAILDTVREAVAKRFPIENDNYRIELADVKYEGPTNYTLAQQKQAILSDRKLGCNLFGTWRLVDKKSGKVLDEKRDSVMRVPYYTNRGTIINNGSEYTVINQARLSPGVYTRRKQNGDLETQFNVANGKGFRLELDRATGKVGMRMGQANIPLYSVLKSMGVSDKELAKAWGNDVALANADSDNPSAVDRLYSRLAGFNEDPLATRQSKEAYIRSELSRFGLDPSTVVRTLGLENVRGVTPEVLLRASQKLINVNRGVEEPDNRDNPRFSKFYGVEHMLGERIDKDSAKLLKPLLFRVGRDKSLARVGRNALGGYIDGFLSTSGLAQPGEEANPMSILTQQSRITRTGEGGISSPDLITPEARGVQGDYLGFVDFIAGPECMPRGCEVFTRNGWIKWEDATDRTEFACLIDGTLEFHHPFKLHAHDYVGDLYCASSKFVSYRYTPNHKMYVNPCFKLKSGKMTGYKFEYAKDVSRRSRNVMTGGHGANVGSGVKYFTLPDTPVTANNQTKVPPIDIRDWSEFMGWYLSEGNTYIGRGKTSKDNCYNVRITQEKYIDELTRLMDRLPLRYRIIKHNGVPGRVDICGKQLALYLSEFGKSADKYIPEYLLDAPIEARERLLKGLMLGDGRRKRDTWTYLTVSERLARDVERLGFGLGFSIHTRFEKDNRPQSNYGGTYAVHFCKKNSRGLKYKDKWYKGNYYTEHYEGKVYCADVPGHLLFVRASSSTMGHWTGNSSSAGVDVRGAYGTVIGRDNKLYNVFRNMRTGKKEYLSLDAAADKTIAFPGQDPKSPYMYCMRDGVPTKVKTEEVDYVVPSFARMLGSGINMNPMPTSVFGMRTFYSSKFWEQYLPQKKGEVPLVDSLMPDGKTTFNEYYGRKAGCVTSPMSGTVTKVSEDGITVTGDDGKSETMDLVTNLPFNRMSAVSFYPTVKKGMRVGKGDILANSNFTDAKTGAFNMGQNLKVAVMTAPRNADSYEDSITISEDAAKRLATTRLYNFDQDTRDGVRISKNGFLAAFPKEFTKEQAEKLDDNGVAKVGVELRRGDPIIAATGPKLLSGENAQLGRLSSVLKNALTNKSQVWEHDWPGVVTDVVAGPNGAKVLIKSEPPIKVGDKLCYDEDTEVLTFDGWKFIKDVTLDDFVATLNPETGEFEYISPEAVRKYEHKGRMYAVRTQSIDLVVTENHRMFVKRRGKKSFGFEEAAGLVGKRVEYKKDGFWVGVDVPTFTFPAHQARHRWGLLTSPGVTIKMDTYLMILGMCLSKGNSGLNCGHRRFGIDMTQVKCGPRLEAMKALDEAGVKYTYNKSSHKITLNGRHLAHHFSQFGHSCEKRIPKFVFGLSRRQQEILFKWMTWGDGHFEKGVPKSYFTSSKGLADDMQRLCLHIGKAAITFLGETAGASRCGIDGRRMTAKRGQYQVQIINSKLTPRVNHSHAKTQFAQSEGFIDYDGFVYCCTMPKWHAIYVRRNGKACWCGNSPRFALKGVVATILPTDKMPRDAATNEPYDMLVNPMGFLSRVAPGQLMEMALGKLARKTGRQVRIPQLPPEEGWLNWTRGQLKENGVSETADVFDPQTGRTIKNIGDGYMYVQAMHHLAEKKFSARGLEGAYTQDQQPAKGGVDGAKKISGFDANALLSHGATEVLKDAMTTRGQSNAEYWRKLRLGLPIEEPGVPFIYEKFLNNLRAGGINVVEKGGVTSIMPQTDADIERMAEGRVVNTSQMVDSDFKPVRGGMFDLGATGGMGGTRWSMIELDEPVPNPVMEEPVRRVLGLTAKGLSRVLSGIDALDGKTGGAAVKEALSKVNVDAMIDQARNDVRTKRGSARDNAVKVLGYLTSAKKMGMEPKDWMISKVPVIPPAFRPISKAGDTALVPDANELYKELIETRNNYATLAKDLPPSALADERLGVYKAVKAAYGLGDSVTAEGQAKNLKGPIRQVVGEIPKHGQFQYKVVAKNQDLVGRSVTVPDKNLSMDQVGIPEEMAWTMYKPFVVRKLAQRGYTPVDATRMIEEKTPAARHILDDVMREKPILMDRAPTWHKFNIMAFKPFIVDGREIRVCPLIDSGFSMDHDGDLSRSPYITTFLSEEFINNYWATKDSDLCYDPSIINYVTEVENMTKESVVVNGENVPGVITNIRWDEFPRHDNPTMNSHPNANFYAVPDGVCVRAYDEKSGGLVWAPVRYWSHHGVNEKIEIVTVELSSGRQIITDDDPRGVYGIDPKTMEFGRWRPSEAVGKFVPRCVKDGELVTSVTEVRLPESSSKRNELLRSKMPLDRETGWFLGAMIGDGWAAQSKGDEISINFCCDKGRNDLGEQFRKAIAHAFTEDGILHVGEALQAKESVGDRYGDAVRLTYSNATLAEYIDGLIGHGDANKHLPRFWQKAPPEFRLGLFEGLMDTDGTLAIVKAKSKSDKQLMSNYCTISMTLATEFQYLCRTLGVDSKLTTQKTPAGGKRWQVSISTKNLKKLGLKLHSPRKAKALEDAEVKDETSAGGRKHIIPVPMDELKRVSGILLELDKSAYISLNKTGRQGYATSNVAGKIAKVLKATPELQTASWKAWLGLYDNLDRVVWERVEGFTNTGMFEEGFDLTVPGYETFMNSEGVIVSNTVNIHVPASEKASKEALEKMLPSKNLFSLTDLQSVRYKPEKEQVSGLWALTSGKSGREVRVFDTKSEAIRAYRNGEIGANDPVEIRKKV